jgi:hypothetical protein
MTVAGYHPATPRPPLAGRFARRPGGPHQANSAQAPIRVASPTHPGRPGVVPGPEGGRAIVARPLPASVSQVQPGGIARRPGRSEGQHRAGHPSAIAVYTIDLYIRRLRAV